MNYDNWKTCDKEYEANCQWWEHVLSLLKCESCGNDDTDFFSEIDSSTIPEGGCDVEITTAICAICETAFSHSKYIDPRELAHG